MSEYIITCDEETASWIGNDVDLMKPIVRCRDCRMFGDCEWNYENEPMGFCSWVYVLKEGGDD